MAAKASLKKQSRKLLCVHYEYSGTFCHSFHLLYPYCASCSSFYRLHLPIVLKPNPTYKKSFHYYCSSTYY